MSIALDLTGVVSVGRKALHASRRTLLRELGDQGAACLQEIGYAAGEELYAGFCAWLPEYPGVSDPGELDAGTFGEVLTEFFRTLGWGTVEVAVPGKSALTITSSDWAEAEPGAKLEHPACYFSSGLLASFLTRIVGDGEVATLEVECRTRDDAHCRFCAGAPETLQAVLEAMSAGKDYTTVL